MGGIHNGLDFEKMSQLFHLVQVQTDVLQSMQVPPLADRPDFTQALGQETTQCVSVVALQDAVIRGSQRSLVGSRVGDELSPSWWLETQLETSAAGVEEHVHLAQNALILRADFLELP